MHMTSHENDVTIGEYTEDHKVTITMRGPLSEYSEGMARYVRQPEGVKSVMVYQEEPVIIAECRPDVYPGDISSEQVRIRIRNKCRDYFADVTGHIANTGENGDYVDLIEDVSVRSAESDSVLPPRGDGGISGG
jgi:hypothetical protein